MSKLSPLWGNLDLGFVGDDVAPRASSSALGTRRIDITVGESDPRFQNTVSFLLDEHGGPTSASGTLRQYWSGVERTSAELDAQFEAAGLGLADDQGGHVVGHRFIGNQGAKNLFPQNAQFNNSAFKVLENDYARLIDQGYEVNFTHTLDNFDELGRPGTVRVEYEALDRNGDVFTSFSREFDNQAGQVYPRRVR